MIKDFEKKKINYAKLIVNRGLSLPKGKIVRIFTDDENLDFINIIVKECYKSGAKRVFVNIANKEIEKTILNLTNVKELKNIPNYSVEELEYDFKNEVYVIEVISRDPGYAKDLNIKKLITQSNAFYKYKSELIKKYKKAPYTIVSAPSKDWAKFLFPKLNETDAIEKLWTYIFEFSHIDSSDNPYKNWDDHCKDLNKKAKFLNDLNIKELHYISKKNNTDLYVGMTDNYQFFSAEDIYYKDKSIFYSNIPTEEIFVSPHRLKINGTLSSSKPLVCGGQIIDEMFFEFKNGKIIKAKAKKNKKLLKLILKGKNMRYLGEAALVPFSSFINKTNILFYTTLIDENASCHFALGQSYTYTYKNYEKFSNDELFEKGLNQSANHIDFMIGTNDMDIIAITKDNKQIKIFNKGEWSI